MKTVNQLVAEIKENGQDFEWYPTTSEIVDALAAKLKNRTVYSILDIGCGNGGFFEKLCKDEKFKRVFDCFIVPITVSFCFFGRNKKQINRCPCFSFCI